jgi:hypothetical protein
MRVPFLPRRASLLSAGLLAALAVAGCPDEEAAHTRIIHEPAVAAAPSAAMPAAAPPSAEAPPMAPGAGRMAGDVPVPPKPAGAEGLTWTLPQGWTESRTGGIRYATLRPPGAGAVDASVVVLPGPAGGELANVNRWRGQLGLPPVEEAQLPSLRKTVTTKVGPVDLFDFSSEKTRLVAGLALVNDSSWFFKMMGDSGEVGAALPGFTHLVESVRPAGGN